MLQYSELNINESPYRFETGVWAKQAGGSILLKWGDTVIMANVTAAKDANEGADFFPLTVDYREKYYAAGQIPGGFFKREARPSEKEILTARVTDRPLRPLFPETFYNETQIFITLLSSDGKSAADAHAINAASAALMISNVPFHGPVGGVKVGRVDNKFILFPTNEQIEQADINLTLAGTEKAVTMIEGNATEVSEEDMLAAVKFGHAEIQKICQAQLELAKKYNKEKIVPPEKEDHSAIKSELQSILGSKLSEANSISGKKQRQDAIDQVKKDMLEAYAEQISGLEEAEQSAKLSLAKHLFEDFEVDVVRDQIFNQGMRADGRKLDEIRDISVEVGVLPAVHGSSLFTRGETQALGVVTLGTENDAQSTDGIEGRHDKTFYLHYNFLPFSVGEVRRYGGPGRREIGHGKLAESGLQALVPSQEKFPYVIRVVSEILESNGSSSMASICAGSLAMMDAGVPMEQPVAGIAMGLITEGEKFAVLSDIAGLEDHFGDMDFKVAGTKRGITAFQLDLKVEGISYEIMEQALAQAKNGRLHILEKMNEALDASRESVSSRAPRIYHMRIDVDRIGELIGPGGKNIRAIQEKSGATITVDDSGTITISTSSAEASDVAKELIESQFAEAEVGASYTGTVKRITDFGAFIEFMPGKQGLCHISKISHERVGKVSDVLKENQEVRVKVLDVDRQGRISLSIKDAED